MFKINTRNYYKRIDGKNTVKPACIINYQSDDTEYFPFIESLNTENKPISEVINFGSGKYGQLTIIRDNWNDVTTAVNAVISELKNLIDAGTDAINYSDKPEDITETSLGGKIWE